MKVVGFIFSGSLSNTTKKNWKNVAFIYLFIYLFYLFMKSRERLLVQYFYVTLEIIRDVSRTRSNLYAEVFLRSKIIQKSSIVER